MNREQHIEAAETCLKRAAQAGNEAKETFWHREGLVHAVLAVALSQPPQRTFIRHKSRSN